MNSIIVVDYGAGNLTSVFNALSFLNIQAKVSRNPEEIASAEKIIFPGVGAAGSAMQVLTNTGIGEAVSTVVKKGRPVLGICIGCQIILDSSDEDGGVPTLGLLHGKAVRFKDEPGLKIPHMGWNQVCYTKEHPIMKGIPDGSDFYYVHSYHPLVANENAFAETTYGSQTFQCIVGKENLIATQFHLEKSGSIGLQVLKNFSSWNV